MNIMIFNGLLLMLFVWTSAELESKKEPTGELQDQEYENERQIILTCRDIHGKCVDRRRECPKDLPLSKPPGKPWCSSKRQHCCYPETRPICGGKSCELGKCTGPELPPFSCPNNTYEVKCGCPSFNQLCCVPILKESCKEAGGSCKLIRDCKGNISPGHGCDPKSDQACCIPKDDSTEPICGEGNDGRCIGEPQLCVRPLKAKCPKGFCCEEVEANETLPLGLCGFAPGCEGKRDVCLPWASEILCGPQLPCYCAHRETRCCTLA